MCKLILSMIRERQLIFVERIDEVSPGIGMNRLWNVSRNELFTLDKIMVFGNKIWCMSEILCQFCTFSVPILCQFYAFSVPNLVWKNINTQETEKLFRKFFTWQEFLAQFFSNSGPKSVRKWHRKQNFVWCKQTIIFTWWHKMASKGALANYAQKTFPTNQQTWERPRTGLRAKKWWFRPWQSLLDHH